MTQEDKDLLIKDLCGRLPYGVKVITSVGGEIRNDKEQLNFAQLSLFESGYEDVKPYLFPLSSMTEEQKEEYCQLQQKIIYNSKGFVNTDIMNYINWCYENHLDVNGLIPLDLAIDCTNLNIY